MSQSANQSSDEPLVQPSKFGRRLGLVMMIVFLVFALFAGIGWLAQGG